MLTTVRLYGKLGKLFGRTWHLDVSSPREAVAAIDANHPGFCAYLLKHSEPGYHVVVGDRDRDEKDLDLPVRGRAIRFIPFVKGRNNGWTKILAGAILVVVGLMTWTGGFGDTVLIPMGISMMLGGAAQLLTKPPTLDKPEDDSRPSYTFNGPVTTTAQGWPMPVGYGTLRIGGALVSMSITAEDLRAGGNTTGFRIVNYGDYTYPVRRDEGLTVGIELLAMDGKTPYTWDLLPDSDTVFSVSEASGRWYLNAFTDPLFSNDYGTFTCTVRCTDDDGNPVTWAITLNIVEA